jgi:AraC family transcriptional regulator, regulatory protein of adaptative response / methylated-DNA-[protein]-cysteine methyltransferase
MNAAIQTNDPASATVRDPRWQALIGRDVSADGSFVYSVKTTGVYCRPSCAARLARPENVRFFATCADAEAAGFRPCKRCKPQQPSLLEQYGAKVTLACRVIDESDVPPSLHELARHIGMSPYHFHRVFKQITGVTPRQYAASRREHRVRNELHSGGRITDAIFDAGYGSNSRFYENAKHMLGMTPSDYRSGGANATIKFAIGECSLGSILVAQSDHGICAILLGEDPEALARDLQDRFPRATLIGGDAEFERLVATVVGFVEAPRLGLNLPLDVRGTSFQRRVWQALREIPPGETASYSEIAQRIGAPKAVRAVAQACGANTLAVAIPCHRVVRNDGALSGYRWGVERKRALLDKEAQA